MANALYDKGREAFLNGGIDWTNDTIKAHLVRSTGGGGGPYYTVNLATDDFLDDIPSNGDCRPSTAQTIGSKTSTDGVADGGDITFSAVASGDAIQYVIVYRDSGVESTSELIAFIDTGNLPVTPNGGDIVVQWNPSGIFKL